MAAYNFSAGAVLPRGTDPQVVGNRLDYLCKKSGLGRLSELSPKLVVEDARSLQSPLHKVFEAKGLWDDKRAAEQARLEFAGYLVRHIYVEVIAHSGERRIQRAFVSVPSKQDKGRVYTPFATAISDEEWREYMLESAKSDFTTFKNKYANLKELAVLWDAGKTVFARSPRKNKAA